MARGKDEDRLPLDQTVRKAKEGHHTREGGAGTATGEEAMHTADSEDRATAVEAAEQGKGKNEDTGPVESVAEAERKGAGRKKNLSPFEGSYRDFKDRDRE